MPSIRPLGDRVLVKELVIEQEERTKSGLFVPSGIKSSIITGVVEAMDMEYLYLIGSSEGKGNNAIVLPTVNKGDVVYFDRHNTHKIVIENEEYLLMSIGDIIGVQIEV